ncbi:PITRM1 isoform 9, partial [Pan troglodytes]
VNATPQQMPQTEKAVEDFLRSIGRSKKERRPVRPHTVEKPVPSSSGGDAYVPHGSQVIRKLVMYTLKHHVKIGGLHVSFTVRNSVE